MRLFALLVLSQLALTPPVGDRLKRQTHVAAQVLIRTDHAPVDVDGERYRLVTPRAPMVAAIRQDPGTRAQLVVYVVRLGTSSEPEEGATPLVVTVDGERHIFPNRPRLVHERVVRTSGEVVEVASYPVRYPLGRVRGREVTVRVALRRPERGGGAGVRLAVESRTDDTLRPVNRLAKRRSRPAKKVSKPEPAPPPAVAAEDAGVEVALADEDRLTEDDVLPLPADAGPEDAGAPAPPVVPEPPPRLSTGRVTVALENNLPEVFALRRIEVGIDGVPVTLPAWKKAPANKAILLFDGDLGVGAHYVDISLTYAGRGGFLFSYLDEYMFHVADGQPVNVTKDGRLDVRVEAYEAGTFINEMVDRPSLRFHLRQASP